MNFIKKNAIVIICILSFFTASFYNQLNLNKIPSTSLRDGKTVATSDDVSYIVPAHNYLDYGEWKDNSIGKQSYFIRPPGYGIFYFVFLKIVDYPLVLSIIKIAQLLLFACSVYWLYFIAFSLIQHKKIALIIAGTYGLTPFAIGFLFYTLTEGITPALLLLYVFLLFKAHNKTVNKHKIIFYFLASFCFAYLLIVRPAIGFLGILLPVFLLKDYWNNGIYKLLLKLVLFGLITISFTTIWQVRNYNITNEIVGLHPIYYKDGNSIYRPPFKEFWKFVGGWAQEGHVAHSYMVPMWKAAINGDTSIIYIENALKTFPKKVITFYGKDRLTNVFRKYQEAVLFQKPYYEKHKSIDIQSIESEIIVSNELKQLVREYKHEFWFDYHIKSPLKVFKIMAFHSNLSLYIFQHTYRGNILMELTRVLFYTLHTLCFIALLIALFLIKTSDWRQSALIISLIVYVFYLCYFQRGIEERYTLPILPFLLITLGYNGNQLFKKLRTKS